MMNKGFRIVKYYWLGVFTSVLIVVLIHLYRYIAEPCFSFAEWDNILLTTLISGIPFGIAIWSFKNLWK
jgi:hypothetical protein